MDAAFAYLKKMGYFEPKDAYLTQSFISTISKFCC
jgi:hypothetical protein